MPVHSTRALPVYPQTATSTQRQEPRPRPVTSAPHSLSQHISLSPVLPLSFPPLYFCLHNPNPVSCSGLHAFNLPPVTPSGGGILTRPRTPTGARLARTTPAASSLTVAPRTRPSPCRGGGGGGTTRRLLGEKWGSSTGDGGGSNGSGSRRWPSRLSSTGEGEGVDERAEGEYPQRGKGLLRRIVTRVVKTGKTVGRQVCTLGCSSNDEPTTRSTIRQRRCLNI